MDFDRSNIKLVIVLLLVAALICGGIVFYGIRKKDNSITYDRDKMVEQAHKFYDRGELRKAVNQLEHYCNSHS